VEVLKSKVKQATPMQFDFEDFKHFLLASN